MSRSRCLAIIVCVALSSCKKSAETAVDPVATRETVAGTAMIDYHSRLGTFLCRAPAAWKADETVNPESDAVSFYGALSDGRMATISVLRYPHRGDDWKEAGAYAESFWQVTPDGKQPALEKKKTEHGEAILFHFEKPFRKLHSSKVEYAQRLDYALIPFPGGFFELWHTAPADKYRETLPVFEAVVRSFKPKN